MKATELVVCRGHPAITGTHRTTFEVTCEPSLTSQGDCIIGVAADKGAAGLSPEFRRILSDDRALLITELVAGEMFCSVRSRGSSQMTLDHPTDLVWRKSGYVCGRTVGIFSDFAARDLPRSLVDALRADQTLTITLRVIIPSESH